MKGTLMKFRDNLLYLRQQRNMTQEQLAMLLGVSRQSVAKWEAGQSTPEVDKLMKIAELFNCTLDELVSGDCTTHDVVASEILPENVPAQDLFGYDEHVRRFALSIAAGVALILMGLTIAALFETLGFGDLPEVVAVIASVIAALAFILPAGINHAAFAKAHPFIEDFYTEEQKARTRRAFSYQLVGGIGIILIGVICGAVGESLGNDNAGGTALFGCLTFGVFLLVYSGILFGLTNVDNYNKERADENWERENPRVNHVCSIIMLTATAIGLLLLFGGMAASSAGVSSKITVPLLSFFWVVWPIGGIGCAIATAAMRASRS